MVHFQVLLTALIIHKYRSLSFNAFVIYMVFREWKCNNINSEIPEGNFDIETLHYIIVFFSS